MASFDIRPARSGDAEAVGRVGYAAWRKGIGTHVPASALDTVSRATFASFAKTHHDQVLVATVGRDLAGFVATEHGDNVITDLWVTPEFGGREIGSMLIAAAERMIAHRGHDTAEIEVMTANVRALGLYQHLGYDIYGRDAVTTRSSRSSSTRPG